MKIQMKVWPKLKLTQTHRFSFNTLNNAFHSLGVFVGSEEKYNVIHMYTCIGKQYFSFLASIKIFYLALVSIVWICYAYVCLFFVCLFSSVFLVVMKSLMPIIFSWRYYMLFIFKILELPFYLYAFFSLTLTPSHPCFHPWHMDVAISP